MDFKNVVFQGARDGKLSRLKLFLDHKPKDEVKKLVAAVTMNTTPLVMSCRNGHLDVVEYLIEKCCADVEQVGCVSFDGETIKGAPPLWCAAAAGHFDVVKKLIFYKAFLNSTTKTNSTPLRAACFDGHYEIAKYLIEKGADIEIANRHGHTCLMIACYKGHLKIAKYLLRCGVDVNRRSMKGNTALHDCAESGSLEIFQMLLQNGARMDADSRGMTPLLSAAVTGHESIVEYLITEVQCTVKEKVDALELLGATFVDKKHDILSAHNFWKRAMTSRYQDVNSPLLKPVHESPIAAYVNASEVHTYGQLEELVSEPDAMRMQALLIRERILGPSHPDTAYYIRFRGAAYVDTGHFDRCIHLWMYALDVQQNVLEPLNLMTQSSLLSFTELFFYMMSEAWSRNRHVPTVRFHDVFNVFQRVVREITNAMLTIKQSSDYKFPCTHNTSEECSEEEETTNFHFVLTIAMHLIGLICKLQPHLSNGEDYEFKQAVYGLVHMNPKSRKGWTPLHIACFKTDSSVGRYHVLAFPSAEVAQLLLEVGASPNAMDFDQNTPLHIAALNRPCPRTVFKTLLNHGAHLDLRNKDNQTALQLMYPASILDIYPLQHLNLQCFCARVIRKAGIPFRGMVPTTLEEFLDGH